jgi:hypothetical protein
MEALSLEQAKSDQPNVIATPKKPRDMYRMIQGLYNEHTPNRKTRLLLQKVSRQLERLTVEAVYKDAQIYSLQSQLEDLKGLKIRKRVAVDLNTKFANVDSIEQAIEEA